MTASCQRLCWCRHRTCGVIARAGPGGAGPCDRPLRRPPLGLPGRWLAAVSAAVAPRRRRGPGVAPPAVALPLRRRRAVAAVPAALRAVLGRLSGIHPPDVLSLCRVSNGDFPSGAFTHQHRLVKRRRLRAVAFQMMPESRESTPSDYAACMMEPDARAVAAPPGRRGAGVGAVLPDGQLPARCDLRVRFGRAGVHCVGSGPAPGAVTEWFHRQGRGSAPLVKGSAAAPAPSALRWRRSSRPSPPHPSRDALL